MTRKEAQVIAAARQWWANRRPLAFTLDAHLDHPTINTSSDTEQALARAVAAITRACVQCQAELDSKGHCLACAREEVG